MSVHSDRPQQQQPSQQWCEDMLRRLEGERSTMLESLDDWLRELDSAHKEWGSLQKRVFMDTPYSAAAQRGAAAGLAELRSPGGLHALPAPEGKPPKVHVLPCEVDASCMDEVVAVDVGDGCISEGSANPAKNNHRPQRPLDAWATCGPGADSRRERSPSLYKTYGDSEDSKKTGGANNSSAHAGEGTEGHVRFGPSSESGSTPAQRMSRRVVSPRAPSQPSPPRRPTLTRGATAGFHNATRSVTFDKFGETRLRTLLRVAMEQADRLGLVAFFKGSEVLQQRFVWKLTRSNAFVNGCAMVILLNSVFIGIQANNEVKAELGLEDHLVIWGDTELAFCIWFTFELILRLAAERITFFFGKEWKTNVFDSSLVFLTIFGRLANPAGTAKKASLARIFRLFRFVRIFRLVRVIRSFQSLRLLAFSIIESLGTLLWCGLMVLLSIYVFAILFMHGAVEYFRDHPESRTSDISMALEAKFGSVMKAMISLFMTISGGIDWSDAITPLRMIHWLYEPIFAFYAFFMLFGVLNVVAATFVENTASIARKDKEAVVYNEMKRVTEYVDSIKKFFHEADVDHSGMLSWEEFEAHLEDDKVKAYFRALELDVSEAHILFELMDKDGSDEVEIDEFIGGCMRLKGSARSIDVNMLIHHSERTMTRMMQQMQQIQESCGRLETRRNSTSTQDAPGDSGGHLRHLGTTAW